jgi:hypothetical protein
VSETLTGAEEDAVAASDSIITSASVVVAIAGGAVAPSDVEGAAGAEACDLDVATGASPSLSVSLATLIGPFEDAAAAASAVPLGTGAPDFGCTEKNEEIVLTAGAALDGFGATGIAAMDAGLSPLDRTSAAFLAAARLPEPVAEPRPIRSAKSRISSSLGGFDLAAAALSAASADAAAARAALADASTSLYTLAADGLNATYSVVSVFGGRSESTSALERPAKDKKSYSSI